MTQTVRAWVYRAAAVLGFVYIVIGFVTGEVGADEVVAGFQVLLASLAAVNTPTKSE